MKEIQTIIGNTKAGIAIVGLMLIGLMSSCSSDDGAGADEQQWAAGVQIGGVNSYMTYFGEETSTRAGEGLTRAWELPTDPGITYESYVLGDQSSIGVWFTRDESEDPAQELGGYLYKSGENWRMNFPNVTDVKGEKKYYVYGYIPHTAGISSSVSPEEVSGLYAKGATLTLTNVPSVLSNDLCVIIGAKEGTDKEHDNGLHRGDFGYTTAATVANNFVFLVFDHLYAALRVSMKVNGRYNALRTIKLKSLQMSTKVGSTYSKDHTNITIVLNANNTGADPVSSVEYAEPSTDKENNSGIEFWSSDEGVALNTDYQNFTGHFMPTGITTLELTSVYDVYDKQGNLIRENCKSTNYLQVNELFSGQTATLRGRRYTIEMTIEPTYLYMMSEDDLDNPTVKVEL